MCNGIFDIVINRVAVLYDFPMNDNFISAQRCNACNRYGGNSRTNA